jgi:hypothetical protein
MNIVATLHSNHVHPLKDRCWKWRYWDPGVDFYLTNTTMLTAMWGFGNAEIGVYNAKTSSGIVAWETSFCFCLQWGIGPLSLRPDAASVVN